MFWWWRFALVLVVALMPGGFVCLLGYVAVRTLRERWRTARAQAVRAGAPVSFRAVLATVHLKELWQQARTLTL